MRRWLITLAALAAAAPLAAQDHPHHHPSGGAGVQTGTLPAGWEARLDRDNASMSNVRFLPMAGGYHVTLGPSGIFYDPANEVDGEFRVQARFTQTVATRHPEAYGLFVGGQNLAGPDQDYLYFLIRQDGRYLVKHRAGQETHTILDWTEHPVIARVAGEEGAVNTLAIEAGPQRARFLVNGVQVANLENVPYLNTAGVAGLRINHNLDLHVQGFAVERRDRPAGNR
jgi:hypothetical protein